MKLSKIMPVLIVILIFFSTDIVKAQTSLTPAEKNTKSLSLAKEKRAIIKEYQKTNKKLEDQVDRKSKKIEKLLVKLPEENLISDEVLQNQLNGKMELIMNHLMQIGEIELSAWDNLKTGNKLINNQKYTAGLKKLDEAIKDLEEKHKMLIDFNKDLDELLIFLNSIQHK